MRSKLGIKVEWDTEAQTAIRVTYSHPWNWSEFEAAQTEVNSMMGSTEKVIDLIFDVRNGGSPPPGSMSKFRQVVQTGHLNRGMIVFVGGVMLVQTFLNLILRIYGKTVKDPNFVFANSLEEARKIIAHQRKA